MPVDLSHSRFGNRQHKDALGAPVIWDCPACGQRNEGRRPEQGCGLCGAGDPSLSKAGVQVTTRTPGQVDETMIHTTQPDGTPWTTEAIDRAEFGPGGAVRVPPAPVSAPPRAQRILRLVEYLITQPAAGQEVLRRSLVGTLSFPWGTLTGTIVDSCDTNQEDRLRLAKLQPGVWLGNPLGIQVGGFDSRQASRAPENPTGGGERRVAPSPDTFTQESRMPDIGPSFSRTDASLAQQIQLLGGYRLCHTLALALSSIAEELAANSEPEKFLSYDECLALASALMAEVPAEWQGDKEDAALDAALPPPADPEAEQRKREIAARIQQASQPTAAPWTDPTARGATKL